MNNSQQIQQRQDYIARINRVLDYIETHLQKNMTLDELAAVAHFSPFHFHRIFSAFVGETLKQFIQRIRLEKAADRLISNPWESITVIALDSGFSGSATFARAFKDYFCVSATEWRNHQSDSESKIGKPVSKLRKSIRKDSKDFDISSDYIGDVNNQLTWRIKMKTNKQLETKVEVKDLPEMTVAYIRHIGAYKGNSQLFGTLIEKICRWAAPRGLLKFPETKIMAVYHDNPDITEEDRLRLSISIPVPADTTVDGEIGKMTIPGGQYATARFELAQNEYEQAWDMVYGGWLPDSGYQPDDRPCFEIYYNDPKDHPEHKCILDICVPVKPL